MKKTHQIICSILLYIFFFAYFFMLLHLLIFQRIDLGRNQYIMRSFNIVPFRTIRAFLSGGLGSYGFFELANITGNILLFTPLGLCAPVIKDGKNYGTYMLWFLLFNVFIEILQWILGVGAADIDDIILNSAGFFMGLMAYKAFLAVFKQKDWVQLFITIISVIAIPVFYIAIMTYSSYI